MIGIIKRNKETVFTLLAIGAMLVLRLYQQLTGHEILNRDQALVAIALIFLCYLCSMVIRLTDDEISRVLAYRGLPKHGEATTADPATRVQPQPLPEHQDARVLFSSRQLGKSRLIQAFYESMRHQHLTLVLDEADLQNTTRSKAEELGTSNVRVLTAARYRNVLLGNNRADHVVIAIKDFPEMLHGMLFASITVSPALEGKAPDWVALIKQTNEGKLAGTVCSYPHCHCPADHPGTEDWCLRGLPTGGL